MENMEIGEVGRRGNRESTRSYTQLYYTTISCMRESRDSENFLAQNLITYLGADGWMDGRTGRQNDAIKKIKQKRK